MGRVRRKNSLQKKKDKLRSTSSLMSHQDRRHDTVAASGSDIGKELAIYDESFARRQIQQHSCTCAVCQKKGYFMKTCEKCWTSRYCREKCLKAHRKGFNQKEMCDAVIGGPRRVILLQIKNAILESAGFFKALVQDSDSCLAWLHIYPPADNTLVFLSFRMLPMQLVPGSFVLLLNGHWNNYQNLSSAAIIIKDIKDIRFVEA
ncbi:uncharacterized protein LOC106066247 isoform X2 [Biomphalaria glabrata]|uniref:Uncharacterized protein LOC106066247 isoform X2 n=1 Tax=Biomphalaria glabrata TaxID=6526 RepID=A0A9W2YZ83_BIOGL|nr:uncharacterized protein LOC106066247 isoform X2 [Biomphalaria glabrata]